MPVPQKPRGEMQPEERADAIRKAKVARYLRLSGRPMRITPEEFAEVRAIAIDCHMRGMAYSDMQKQTGVLRHIYGDLVAGRRKTLNRATYDRAIKLRFEPPVADRNSRRGSYLDPTGTARRLEALRALGFPLLFLAERIGCQPQNVRYLGNYRKGVHLPTRERIDRMYEELRDRKPQEFGYDQREINRQETISRKHGFAPPSCWDVDTIDDPSAVAEWTGACGTTEGYRIHVREAIPLCPPCKTQVETRPPARGETLHFQAERFMELMTQRGEKIKPLAERAGVAPDTLLKWRLGERTPRYRVQVERLAALLQVDTEELVRVEPQAEREPTREVNTPGLFNPHTFAIALDLNGISMKGAARILGLNEGSVRQWLTCVARPRSRSVLAPILPELGMKVEEFYQ